MILSGTGHRPDKLGGYSDSAFDNLVKIAEDYLKESKPDKVISGMALGWDQALAEACVNLNIPFIAAVPFKGQESKWYQSSIANLAHLPCLSGSSLNEYLSFQIIVSIV